MTRSHGTHRYPVTLAVTAALLAACASDGPTGGKAETPLPPTPFLVSNPVAETLSVAGRIATSTHASPTVAWVSLPPGSFPDANAVTIRDQRTGAETIALVTDGGFDPVAIAADVGDTLAVSLQGPPAGGPASYLTVVPLFSAPRVVRTNPPRHKRDVPLSSIIVVTFSEPMDSASVAGAIALHAGATSVPGSAAVLSAGGMLHASFTPATALAPLTDYVLEIEASARDQDGDRLPAPMQVDFTTQADSGVTPPDTTGTPPDTTPRPPFHMAVNLPRELYSYPPIGMPAGPVPTIEVTYQGCAAGCDTTYTGEVTLGLGARPIGAVLGGTTTVHMVNGVAAFTGLSLGLGGVYSLIATAPGAIPDTSSAFEVCVHLCWERSRAPMPTPRSVAGVGVVGATLYAIGGIDRNGAASAAVEAYDPATDSWTARAPMPTARYAFGIGVVNGIVYVAGGITPAGTTADVEAYDPATNTWNTRAPLPVPTQFPAAAGVNGLLYVVGGQKADSTTLATVMAYDPATDQWSSRAPLPAPRSLAGLAVSDGLLYVIGGLEAPSIAVGGSTIAVYDPAADAWSVRTASYSPTFLAPWYYGPLLLAIGVLPDKRLVVVGGSDGTTSYLGDLYARGAVYDPVGNQYSDAIYSPFMGGLPAAGVVNGELYVVGSETDRFVP